MDDQLLVNVLVSLAVLHVLLMSIVSSQVWTIKYMHVVLTLRSMLILTPYNAFLGMYIVYCATYIASCCSRVFKQFSQLCSLLRQEVIDKFKQSQPHASM